MDAVSLLQVGSALLLNIGFTWLVGSWLARWWMHSSGIGHDDFEPALRKLDLAAAGLGAAGSTVALLAATAVMGGVGLREACPMFWTMVSSTDYGHAACITILAMLAVFALRLPSGTSRLRTGAAFAFIAIFAVTRSSMGHAGEDGLWSAALAAEAVHFSAIGVWTGAVMVSGWFVLNASRVAAFNVHMTDRYLDLMSQGAMLAVIAILGTGLYSAWHRVGTSEHLFHSTYGTILLVKIGLVLAAIAMGGYNKFVGLPAASRSSRGLGVVRTVLQAETFLLVGALLAAAALTSQQPPASM
jgi:putative copper resistance protein D